MNLKKGIIILMIFFGFIFILYPDEKEKKYFQADISKHANMEFEDKKSGDHSGGWSDKGGNDMRGFPAGLRNFDGITFNIIDPQKNNGKSLIILKSKSLGFFPEAAKNIAINKSVSRLFFLNACDTSSPKGDIVARYIVHYAGGLDEDIPVRYGIDTANSWIKCNEDNITNAKLVWTSKNSQADIGAFLSSWSNPWPDFEIISIDFISTVSATGPALIALTAEISNPGSDHAVNNNNSVLIMKLKKQQNIIKELLEKIVVMEAKMKELEKNVKHLDDDMTTLWNKESGK